jgi:hypothetical protein
MESYPFDWLVSKLEVIKDCIETKFIHFLDPNNYKVQNTETYNLIDNNKIHICDEIAHINTYYENNENNNSTYNFQLALNHYNLQNDYDYYTRCVNRLYELFESDIKKYYIYFNPIIGINDFNNNKDDIVNNFDTFNQFIIKQTKNIFGIYFILIKHNENILSYKIKETLNYDIIIIYCNDNFLDGGDPFMGISQIEKEEVINILKQYFI